MKDIEYLPENIDIIGRSYMFVTSWSQRVKRKMRAKLPELHADFHIQTC